MTRGVQALRGATTVSTGPHAAAADFTEFLWLPFAVGALGLLFLRAAVHGELGKLLDVAVLYLYFTGFSLWSFGYKLWSYGHHLAPTAAVKVAPFMPPMFGHRKLANFDVSSWFGMFMQAGTPRPIMDAYNAEIKKMLERDDIKKNIAAMGAVPDYGTPEQYAAFIDAEIEKWARVVRSAKLKPQ